MTHTGEIRLVRAVALLWADRWRTLRAWGRPLTCTVRVRGPRQAALGYCWSRQQHVEVHPRVGKAGMIVDVLCTILHEYAHAAAPDAVKHRSAWQRIYAEAVREATGMVIGEDTVLVMDEQARIAIKFWLER